MFNVVHCNYLDMVLMFISWLSVYVWRCFVFLQVNMRRTCHRIIRYHSLHMATIEKDS